MRLVQFIPLGILLYSFSLPIQFNQHLLMLLRNVNHHLMLLLRLLIPFQKFQRLLILIRPHVVCHEAIPQSTQPTPPQCPPSHHQPTKCPHVFTHPPHQFMRNKWECSSWKVSEPFDPIDLPEVDERDVGVG
jgi:hypothetical protein